MDIRHILDRARTRHEQTRDIDLQNIDSDYKPGDSS